MGCVNQKQKLKITSSFSCQRKSDTTASRRTLEDFINNDLDNDWSKIKISNFIVKNQSRFEHYYETLSRIGSGSYGSVYKVVHKSTGLVRAMKMIRKDNYPSKKNKEFLQEIEILMKLEHPNIIKIYEYFSNKNYLFLIMEYIPGGELIENLIKTKNFNEEKAAYIFNQIFSAVNYLHSNGLIHRDIKPENILVTNNKDGFIDIKLIDFGSSCNFKPNQKFTSRIGSPFYIAPEVLNHEYNNKCDIWSIGVILYFLLTGYQPFYSRTREDLFEKIKRGIYNTERKEWIRLSKEAKDLVIHTLDYDYESRYSAEECLKHPWLKNNEQKRNINEDNQNFFEQVLMNISALHVKEKLQQATIAYIVHSIYTDNEIDTIKKVFQQLDTNKDGILSYNELQEGIKKYYALTGEEGENIEEIIRNIDSNADGVISYEEFLRAAVNKLELLKDNNLKIAFDNFDLNKDGKLSKKEIKAVLGVSDYEYINKLLSAINSKNKGFLSFEDFKRLMISIIQEKNGDNNELL